MHGALCALCTVCTVQASHSATVCMACALCTVCTVQASFIYLLSRFFYSCYVQGFVLMYNVMCMFPLLLLCRVSNYFTMLCMIPLLFFCRGFNKFSMLCNMPVSSSFLCRVSYFFPVQVSYLHICCTGFPTQLLYRAS